MLTMTSEENPSFKNLKRRSKAQIQFLRMKEKLMTVEAQHFNPQLLHIESAMTDGPHSFLPSCVH